MLKLLRRRLHALIYALRMTVNTGRYEMSDTESMTLCVYACKVGGNHSFTVIYVEPAVKCALGRKSITPSIVRNDRYSLKLARERSGYGC